MECPHLSKSAKIISNPSERIKKEWPCSVCKSTKSSWICLHCGIVNCGRFVNGHAKEHYEANPEHSVCMDCNNLSGFCYICDEFVINDTEENNLEKLRQHLTSLLQNHSAPPKTRRRTLPDEHSVQVESRLRKRIKTQEQNIPPQINSNKPEAKEIKAKVVGLRNLGNTCFMNAVLQSLRNIEFFCRYFLQLPVDCDSPKNGRRSGSSAKVAKVNGAGFNDHLLMVDELRKTFLALWQGGKSAVSPESLFSAIWKVVPRFRGYQQQDAHEFLRYILDRLHTEMVQTFPFPDKLLGNKTRSTIITHIFGGTLQNEVKCLICGAESKKHDPFLDLSLDIPLGQQTNGKSEELVKTDDAVTCQLLDCLSSFTELEELAETELYYCGNCKSKQRSTKKFWIRRLPNVLCLHLKRFRWNNCFRSKLDNYVSFPLKGLDMSNFILSDMHETRGNKNGSYLYDLEAVIVHHGSGAGSGHYTAYAAHEGNWFHFNDNSVTYTDEETVAKCHAYIFFYLKRDQATNRKLKAR